MKTTCFVYWMLYCAASDGSIQELSGKFTFDLKGLKAYLHMDELCDDDPYGFPEAEIDASSHPSFCMEWDITEYKVVYSRKDSSIARGWFDLSIPASGGGKIKNGILVLDDHISMIDGTDMVFLAKDTHHGTRLAAEDLPEIRGEARTIVMKARQAYASEQGGRPKGR